jgi:hypothetical protein
MHRRRVLRRLRHRPCIASSPQRGQQPSGLALPTLQSLPIHASSLPLLSVPMTYYLLPTTFRSSPYSHSIVAGGLLLMS